MRCSCGAEIAARSKFCPHCGQRVGEDLSTPTTRFLRTGGATTMMSHAERARPASAPSGGATTVTVNPWSPPLPIKFQELLRAGMKPEVIIWDLFRHKTIVRNLLESLATDWPADEPSTVLESALQYLQSHCMVCGKRTRAVESGQAPLCADCDRTDA